jgi:hypothetical protein
MRLRGVTRIIALSVLSAFVAATAVAQSGEPSAVYSPQDVPLHATLAERLKVYLDHEQNSRWGDLYDMLYKPSDWKVSREKFIADMTDRESKFPALTRNLIPEFVGNRKNPDHPQYAMLGCLEQEHWGRTRWLKGGVEAHLVNGEWLFSAFYTIAARGQQPAPCEVKLLK